MSEEFLLSTTEEIPHGWNKELDEGQGCRGDTKVLQSHLYQVHYKTYNTYLVFFVNHFLLSNKTLE